jgi:hypothetical protein
VVLRLRRPPGYSRKEAVSAWLAECGGVGLLVRVQRWGWLACKGTEVGLACF